jgi:hypothetical protein
MMILIIIKVAEDSSSASHSIQASGPSSYADTTWLGLGVFSKDPMDSHDHDPDTVPVESRVSMVSNVVHQINTQASLIL